jgi:hypothetical protein
MNSSVLMDHASTSINAVIAGRTAGMGPTKLSVNQMSHAAQMSSGVPTAIAF